MLCLRIVVMFVVLGVVGVVWLVLLAVGGDVGWLLVCVLLTAVGC